MVDKTLIKLIPADESHHDFSYQLTVTTMGDYTTKILGWDDKTKRKYHDDDWQSKRPLIIIYDNKPIGTIYVLENESHTEIGQFYLLPEYQNKGIGSYLLNRVLSKSDKNGLPTILAVLKANPAISLYRKHGFVIIDSNEYQYLMERQPGGNG